MSKLSGEATTSMASARPFATLKCSQPHVRLNLTFARAKDLVAWAEKEQRHWNDLLKALPPQANNVIRALAPAQKEINAYRQLAQQATYATKDPGMEPQCRKELKNLEERISTYEILCSPSDLGTAVTALRDTPPRLLLALSFSQEGTGPQADWINQRIFSFEDLLSAYRVRFPANLAEVDPSGDFLRKEQENLQQLQKSLNDKIDETDSLAETLKTKLTLDPSFKYWADKASGHRRAARWSGATITGFIALLLIWGFCGGFEQILSIVQAHFGASYGATDHWGYVVLFTIPTVAVFYAMRPLMKYFVFNLQRSGDAGERATMVQTYLALTQQEGRKPTEAERLLILRQLFRPGPGDTPDDSHQDTLLEQIIRGGR